MKIVSRRQLAASIAEKFKTKYYSYLSGWVANYNGQDAYDVYHKLLALGKNPSFESIEKILGPFGKDWLKLECSSCKNERDSVVLFEMDHICFYCLKEAIDKFNKFDE